MRFFVRVLVVALVALVGGATTSGTAIGAPAFSYDAGITERALGEEIAPSEAGRDDPEHAPQTSAPAAAKDHNRSTTAALHFVAPNSRLGGLVDVAVDDPAAQALAQRLGGRPSVRFAGDASRREFDVVSDLYVAQSKPANFQLGSRFRNQARATFETALETGRTPYFHFEGPPQAGVIAKLEEYGASYGVDPIIDVSPLG